MLRILITIMLLFSASLATATSNSQSDTTNTLDFNGNSNNFNTLLAQPVFKFKLHNCSSKNINWGFNSGFAVAANNKYAPLNVQDNKISVPATTEDTLACLNDDSKYVATVKSVGIAVKDNRVSYYVPGSVGVEMLDDTNNLLYSLYLIRLNQGYQIFNPQVYKYAYVSNVQQFSHLTMWLHYYDPTHIGAHTDDYLCSNLSNITKHTNGGYIQSLDNPVKANDINFDVYICDNTYQGSCKPSSCFEDPGY